MQNNSSSKRRRLRRPPITYRGERRSQNDAPHSGFARGAQNPKRAVASRHDQLVVVLWDARRKGGCNMQHVVAAPRSL